MAKENYIKTDGSGNIVLQDITGRDININDTAAIKKVFETTTPEYIKELYKQIDNNYNKLIKNNKTQTEIIIALIKEQADKRAIQISESKNILTGSISGVGGNINIGDTIINKNNLFPVYAILVFVVLFVVLLLFKNDIFKLNTPTEKQKTTDTTKIEEADTNTTTVVKVKELPQKENSKTLKSQKLDITITTNKGSKPVFKENDKVVIKYKLNKPAYVRVIYLMADSSAVLLAENLYVDAKNINTYIQTPYNFVCAEPFGIEKLVAYAQAMPFEKLNTKIEYGYEFITQSIYSAYQASEKGLKKEIEFAKKELTITTKSKNE